MMDNKKILINYLLYIILGIFIMFYGVTHSLALTYTNIGEMRNVTQQLVSTNYGSAPFDNPVNSGYAFNEVLQVDYIVSNYNFEANKNYQLESHLSSQQLTNANSYSVAGLNGESCLISYENSIFRDAYPRWAFQCPHATDTITISIKNSSNNYLWNGTGVFNWQTALLKYSDTSLSGSGTDTDNIINNNNQNTQNIINNQNQNTQNIINSNKVCNMIDNSNVITSSHMLNSSGEEISISYYGITNYIGIQKSTIQTFNVVSDSAYSCFYDTNKSLISCVKNQDMSENGYLTIPSNAKYFRASIQTTYQNKPRFNICTDGNQALNDTLNDDNTTDAENEASDFFNSFSTNTFGLTSIITAPLNLIQSLATGNCGTLRLKLPYLDNKYLFLPCMSTIYYNYFGQFFTMYQTITYGIIAYWVIVRIFNQVKDFKNPEHDEIEVLDL